MKMITQAQKGMEGFEPAKLEETGETMMEEMISQFEELGEKEDYNEVSVVRYLLDAIYYIFADSGDRRSDATTPLQGSHVRPDQTDL
jgi:hypothetical protein